MKQKLLNGFLLAMLLLAAIPAQAGNWKLKNTKTYVTGGYWEDGQKVRVDCSYKNGVFQYERKVTSGSSMSVYNAKAEFALPKSSYEPGEDISVLVEFSDSGDKGDYASYARVTLLPDDPRWSKKKGAEGMIGRSATPRGQAVDAAGRNVVTPTERVTLMAEAYVQTTSRVMCIVYSCNGMDVQFLYEWEGEPVFGTDPAPSDPNPPVPSEPAPAEPAPVEPTPVEPAPVEPTPTEPVQPEPVQPEPVPSRDQGEPYNFPLTKLLVVSGIALVLIAAVLFLVRPKGNVPAPKKKLKKEPEPEPKDKFCPNCGARVSEEDRFCPECGQKL